MRRVQPLLAALLALQLAFALPATGEDGHLAGAEALHLSRAGDLTIVDVRTPPEWRTDGLAEGAVALSLHGPGGEAGFLERMLDLVDGDRDRPLAMICRTGARSSVARAYLIGQGFTQVYDISSGMHGQPSGWLADGLPVEPCTYC